MGVENKVSKYVLDFAKKRELLEAIPEKQLRKFLQGRGIFCFGSKDQMIDRAVPIFFGFDDTKKLFQLAGWEME